MKFNINVTDIQWKCCASVLRAFRGFKTAYCSVGLIEVCLSGNYNDVKVAICLHDSFAIQKFVNNEGRICSALSLFCCRFPFDYAIREVQERRSDCS